MYGITISPTMMSDGITTPAIHGSKYTSISCRPRKYQGALDGFMVRVGFAGSSSGAFSVMDQTIRMTVTMMAARNSMRSRYGQTWTSRAQPGLNGCDLAMVRLGHRRIGFELRDQAVVGERLAQPVPGIERHHEQQQHDRDVVRSAEDGPELMKIHKASA